MRRRTAPAPSAPDPSVVAARELDDRRLSRLLRPYDQTRQQFRRAELIRRLSHGPLAVDAVERSRLPLDRCRLRLTDGPVVDLRLLWPPVGDAVVVSGIHWREGLAWEVKVVDARAETMTWYAWSLRIR